MTIQRRRMLQAVGIGGLLLGAGCTRSVGTGSRGQSRHRVGDGELVLATTTSTFDTGLLGALNPAFEERFDLTMKTIAKGTGASLRTARDGDADVILVHARPAEDAFLADGVGVNRRNVMVNDFVLVGPTADPADVNRFDTATAAFEAIARSEAPFLSRGDGSGTHRKERQIWAETNIDPRGRWYQEVGKGMGDTLVQASQSGAYTLADRGTFLAMQDQIELVIHLHGPLEGGPRILLNPYGIMAVNPGVHGNVNYQAAMAYIGFLTSPEGQSMIAEHTSAGHQLFIPNAIADAPDFQQYVPQGYAAESAGRVSAADGHAAQPFDREWPGVTE